jgi:hypothetical protein
MFLGLALTSCKKDEPPPPLPSAAPQPSTPPATVELQPIAEAALDASAPAAPKSGSGGGAKPASIAACCAALEQNAASAPEPNATYMKQAAAFCKAQGSANPATVSIIAGMLRGAGLPASCK